jgi:hypothetical protein
MSDKTGPSWKHSGGQAARPATSRKAWQPGKPQASRTPTDPRKKYRRRWVLASVSLGLLVGLIVIVILLIKPPKTPTFIVVAPDAPDSTVVPINAGSSRTVQGMKEFADKEKLGEQFHQYADPGDAARKWFESIDKKSGPLVLHFACPGATDKTGPFLWLVPADASVAEVGHRLKLTDILDHLRNDVRPERPKLLILDAATEPVSWARGQLHNDFARQLRGLDRTIKDIRNLVVICSADEDQRSWISEEWRQPVFGHYLQQGLQGAAAEANAQLNAWDLFQYVASKVSQWAQSNRYAKQTPFLLPLPDTADPSNDGPTRARELVLAALGPDAYVAPDAEKAPGYSFSIPQALQQEWARRDRLEKMSPAPETKAPQLWRQYLDLLLRAEMIARVTGDVPEKVQSKLRDLATKLADPVWSTPLPCVSFSLPAGPALGFTRKEVLKKQLQDLWDEDKKPDAKKPEDKWNSLAGSDPDRMRPAFGDAVIRHLLNDQLPDKPALDRAETLLGIAEDGRNRPVETHLLRILQRFLGPGRDPTLVRLALQVQVAAERAAWFTGPESQYPYAEQVALWFGKDLAEADKNRRDGTDLVFAGDPQSGATATGLLSTAGNQYKALAEKAAALGAAYRTRDLVLTRLPYYARWAAGLRVKDQATDRLLEQVEQTADKAHALADLLEKRDPQRLGVVNGLVKDLVVVKDLVGTEKPVEPILQLESDFLASLPKLSDRALPANWHALDSALNVPFIPSGKRGELLDKLRLVSQGLHKLSNPQVNTQLVEPVSARELAERHGRMALAILGAERLREFQGGEQPLALAAIQERLRVDVGEWWKLLADAGDRIGTSFSALPPAAARSSDTAAGAEGEKAAFEVTRAARLARLIDGATVLAKVNPAHLERRYWMHKLLMAQATRSAQDGWADLGEGSDRPYCMRVAGAYLDSARDVLLDGEKDISATERLRRIKPVEEDRARLRYATFELTGGDRIYLTDREKEPLRYGVEPKDGPLGYPVVRVAGITPPVQLSEFPRNEFRAVNDFAVPQTEPAARALDLAVAKDADAATGRVDLQLLYRGRLVKRPVEVVQADITNHWIYRQTDAKASMAIKGEGALRSGAVAVLFDMSDSMTDEDDQKESRQSRAAKGLKSMLAGLPKGTWVSVSTFAGANQTVETFQPPIQWNQPDVQAELIYKKLSAPQDKYGAWTPLAHSIVAALDSDGIYPSKDFEGYRSLIVITDGCDTKIDAIKHPATPSPGQVVLDRLNQAGKRDVTVHLVLFGGDSTDTDRAYVQFGAIADPASYKNKERTPAQIWPSKAEYEKKVKLVRADQLAARLSEAMLPHTTVISYDERFERRLPTSIGNETTIRWLDPTVKPSIYNLTALGGTQSVELGAGQRLLLDLEADRKGPKFTLPPFAVAYGLTGAPRETSTDRTVHLTVLRNSLTQPSNSYDLELAAALEKPITERTTLLRRELPLFAWFEVTPADADKGKAPVSLRMEFLHRQLAPMWSVKARRWVPRAGQTEVALAAARAQVNAYWLDDEPPRNLVDFAKVSQKEKLSVDGINVTIDRDITLSKDRELTVRLTHEPNKPVLVRVSINGASRRWNLNEEHKFFDTANKYTAVFGPIQETDLPHLTFEFFSLATIRERAKKVSMELKQAPDLKSHSPIPGPILRD